MVALVLDTPETVIPEITGGVTSEAPTIAVPRVPVQLTSVAMESVSIVQSADAASLGPMSTVALITRLLEGASEPLLN